MNSTYSGKPGANPSGSWPASTSNEDFPNATPTSRHEHEATRQRFLASDWPTESMWTHPIHMVIPYIFPFLTFFASPRIHTSYITYQITKDWLGEGPVQSFPSLGNSMVSKSLMAGKWYFSQSTHVEQIYYVTKESTLAIEDHHSWSGTTHIS